MIWHSGIASLICSIASKVQRPSLRSSSLPVQIVKVSGSNKQVRGRQAVPVAGEVVKPAGDGELVRRLLGHAGLVDRQAMTAAPKRRASLQAFFGRLLAILEIDRVDDRLAAVELERRFEHRVFGRVDDQRRVDGTAHAGHRLGHVGDLVATDKGGAEVERVRAFA